MTSPPWITDNKQIEEKLRRWHKMALKIRNLRRAVKGLTVAYDRLRVENATLKAQLEKGGGCGCD